MTEIALREALNHVNASREKRTLMAKSISERPDLVPLLLNIVKNDQDPVSCKASWVLEYVAKENLRPILKNIDIFISLLPIIRLESSIRPVAKICELLTKAYAIKRPHPAKIILTESHFKIITEAAFDWLIGDHKVASKAYAMTILLLIGHKIAWIHPELKGILTQNYDTGSAAYKARARMTLNAMSKIKNT